MCASFINCFLNLIETSKNFVQVFGQINRLNELKKYYYQCEKVRVVDAYTKIVNEIASANSLTNETNLNGEQIEELLKSFLDQLIEIWHNEVKYEIEGQEALRIYCYETLLNKFGISLKSEYLNKLIFFLFKDPVVQANF